MYEEAIAEFRKVGMPWCGGFLGNTLCTSGPGEGKLEDCLREMKERWKEQSTSARWYVVYIYAGLVKRTTPSNGWKEPTKRALMGIVIT